MTKRWIENTKRKYPTVFEGIHWCNFDCGPGWKRIIRDLIEKLLAVEPTIRVVQIKEKFGTLRFYIGPCPRETADRVYELIGKAEAKSGVVCEWCGRKGQLRQGGWLLTLCDACEQKKLARRIG